jgi:ATP-dependent DNA helicase RecG
MLDDAELQALLTELESDRVERKASIADKDKICEAICAFANDLADHRKCGVVFIGANDDGSCANLAITDQLLQTLGGIRSDGNILPLPEMTVHKRSLGGCELAVVEVHPSTSPPVRYRGRVWIRVGPRRAIASREEERRLSERRRSLDLPFDHQPVNGATSDDLNASLFEQTYLPSALPLDVLSQNDRTLQQQLTALHFLSSEGIPNVAGILTVGKDPRSWIPGAYVQFVRFDGAELTDPIRHQDEVDGALPELLAQLDRVLASQVSVETVVANVGPEARRPDYPLGALSQIVRNAVMHRSYEATNAPIRVYWFADRIEVHSPGGPFGQVTAENIGQPGVTDYRNPLLAEAMKTLGYVQRFGMGFPLAQKELASNGNPPLTVQSQPSAVLVTLRRQP